MIDTLSREIIANELARVRAAAPLVHVMTNEVVQEITANVLLAVGASPAMIVAEEEVAPFVSLSGALLVNVGTLYPERLAAMRLAIALSTLGWADLVISYSVVWRIRWFPFPCCRR